MLSLCKRVTRALFRGESMVPTRHCANSISARQLGVPQIVIHILTALTSNCHTKLFLESARHGAEFWAFWSILPTGT